MTAEAKQLINCVFEAKGRFGKNIIIDTVAGTKTARLDEVGTVSYKTYGVLAKANRNLLKRLMEQLILEGYLLVGDFQTVKLGDIDRLKDADTRILVKITDEDKLPAKAGKKKSKGTESLTSAGYKLFDRLRALRLEIAREENMSPYIIFSDKTLTEMAVSVPVNKEEMLSVSGVGNYKFLKYGKRFLSVIEECIADYPELAKGKD